MITISTILILIYAYSIYKIRIDSGSWEDFDPSETNHMTIIAFIIGTVTCIVTIIGLAINILP
jgi:hypothetical protein